MPLPESLNTSAGGVDVDGDLATTEQQDAAAFDGTAVRVVDGDLAVTEQQDIAAFSGVEVDHAVTGGISAVEQQDAAAFAGEKTYVGDFSPIEQLDIATFNGTAVRLVDGSFAVTEQVDDPTFNGSVFNPGAISGSFAPVEQKDVAAFAGVKTFVGDLAALEQLDLASFNGTAVRLVDGSFAVTEQVDVAAFSGSNANPLAVTGSFAPIEQKDVAAFAGEKTYVGNFAPTEAQDAAAFSGTAVRLVDGDFAVTENQDVAFFTTGLVEELGVSDVALRDGNMGIGASAQTAWRDGAPVTGDGINLPQGIGLPLAPVNFVTESGAIRQARLLQAIANTPAGTDVLPGWFCDIDVKTGEWVWCVNRTVVIANVDNPIGKDDVAGT